MPERIMSRTSVETEHIPPAPVLVASTKKPSDVVDQRHGVRADAVREHLTVRRGLAPVHERRRYRLSFLRVRQVRRVAHAVQRPVHWDVLGALALSPLAVSSNLALRVLAIAVFSPFSCFNRRRRSRALPSKPGSRCDGVTTGGTGRRCTRNA